MKILDSESQSRGPRMMFITRRRGLGARSNGRLPSAGGKPRSNSVLVEKPRVVGQAIPAKVSRQDVSDARNERVAVEEVQLYFARGS